MSLAFRLGLFVVGGLLVLAIGIFLIGSKQDLFHPTYALRAEFDTVAGLNNGAEVRVGGIHEGTVHRIDLPRRPDEKVTVQMELERPTLDVLKKDSTASIKSAGLLGDKYVDISFGSAQAGSLKGGDTIGSEPPLDISDLVKKTNDILDTTKETMQNVDTTTGNLEAVSTKINQGKGTVGALINDKSVYRNVNAGATNFADDMEAFKHNFFLRGFFHKRGYEDTGDLTKHLVSKLPDTRPVKEFDFEDGRLFGKTDAAKLKKPKSLNDAGSFLEQNQFGLVVIVARGGLTGDTDKVRLNTEAQAMSVRDYLVQNFRLDDARLKTFGAGKVEDSPGRVEILIYPPEKSAAQAQNSHVAR